MNANISLSRFSGLGLGGLIFDRRMPASPLNRGVFYLACVLPHGVVRSGFIMGGPCGTPSGVQSPIDLSANPHGLAHPLGGGRCELHNSTIGVTP